MSGSHSSAVRDHPIIVALIGAVAIIAAAVITASCNAESSPPESHSEVPAALRGKWQGSTTEHNGQTMTYRTTLTLRDGTKGSEVGETQYEIPGAPCRGTVRLSSASGNTLNLDERIDSGPCLPSGTIRVALEGEGIITFHYEGTKKNATDQVVEGSLRKVG